MTRSNPELPLQTVPQPPAEEWLAERTKYALVSLHDCVEVDPDKVGGVPVLRGTRFTVAQLFAEISEGRSLPDIAEGFRLDLEQLKKVMEGLSIHLDRPLQEPILSRRSG
jgi:uncharacterized protein (DUF433 family)